MNEHQLTMLTSAGHLVACEPRVVTPTMMRGTACELVGGVTAILAVATDRPAIATIAIGGVLLVEGATSAARRRATAQRAIPTQRDRDRSPRQRAEILGGLVGLAIGILVLLGTLQVALLGVPALAFGIVLYLGAPVRAELARLAPGPHAETAIRASSVVMTLAGLGALAAGVALLLGATPAIARVALAFVGTAIAFAGAALATRFAFARTR